MFDFNFSLLFVRGAMGKVTLTPLGHERLKRARKMLVCCFVTLVAATDSIFMSVANFFLETQKFLSSRNLVIIVRQPFTAHFPSR
jgi:hypothetical protein